MGHGKAERGRLPPKQREAPLLPAGLYPDSDEAGPFAMEAVATSLSHPGMRIHASNVTQDAAGPSGSQEGPATQGHSHSRGTGEAGGTGLTEQEAVGPGPPSWPDSAACPTPRGAGCPRAPEVTSL